MPAFLRRSAVAAAMLTVSVIWEKMVYTIPVLAALLFVAAGLPGLRRDPLSRQLEDTADQTSEPGFDSPD